jgi:hypothetical protein
MPPVKRDHNGQVSAIAVYLELQLEAAVRGSKRDSIGLEMYPVRRRLIAFCLAIPLGIQAQDRYAAPAPTEHPRITPLTVCELLESAEHYAGKVVAVVGRLSSNPFDGAWLSENGCDDNLPRRDPNWPYAVFLGCFGDKRPNPGKDQLEIDADALKAKLDRLRKTTRLEYYTPLFAPRPGEPWQRPQPKKETWAVAFGRVKLAPRGAGRLVWCSPRTGSVVFNLRFKAHSN